jgi:hypothetical protein
LHKPWWQSVCHHKQNGQQKSQEPIPFGWIYPFRLVHYLQVLHCFKVLHGLAPTYLQLPLAGTSGHMRSSASSEAIFQTQNLIWRQKFFSMSSFSLEPIPLHKEKISVVSSA